MIFIRYPDCSSQQFISLIYALQEFCGGRLSDLTTPGVKKNEIHVSSTAKDPASAILVEHLSIDSWSRFWRLTIFVWPDKQRSSFLKIEEHIFELVINLKHAENFLSFEIKMRPTLSFRNSKNVLCLFPSNLVLRPKNSNSAFSN